MTYQPEDPLRKAELMAVEMRRSRKMALIALKRQHNSKTTEEGGHELAADQHPEQCACRSRDWYDRCATKVRQSHAS